MELAAPAFEILTVKSGAKTLRCLQRKETFHPGIGPLEEANILHVEQQRIVARAQAAGRLVLWDVGLGAAANVIAVMNALSLAGHAAEIEIHSFDISTAPLEFALGQLDSLTYLAPYASAVQSLVREGQVQVAPKISWHFHAGDFRQELAKPGIPKPQGILYDPYSPNTNRDMWTLGHFSRLHAQLEGECLLTNYTRSTAVRVTWLLAGFYVGIGAIIGEKAETSVAATTFRAIERPLDKIWLERVKISRNGAPIRGEQKGDVPISETDYARLLAHPQFA
ncbi:MAG: hypothetical protein EOP11_08745 [Proteobacteria bacterium]|nr:MAG: hypothetical protein EOP11_08745 [Pseudomonadota bacterium]